MRVFLANLLWFLSTLPDTVRFAWAVRHPVRAQARVARRRKPTRPEDILLHEPTSGTTGGTKWIPYTEQLRREFMRAVNPWMASLYLRHPGLFFGTHYWIISPYTEVKCPADGKRRGFAEDREYLGAFRCWLTRTLFPLPASLALERDPERHLRRTAEGLLAARDLGLVSVWHPSAFLRLLAYMRDHAAELAEGPRRAALAEGRYADLWPRLRLISCWDAAFARADADRLRALFPKVEVEGKGLLATEGVVTFPWFGRRVAAVTSHTLGFVPVDAQGEPTGAPACGVGEVARGGRYAVRLTTGNGLTAYPLGDVVECTGFVRKTPVLEFLFRSGGWVDLHGEKMSPAFAGEVLERLAAALGRPRFAVFVPRDDRRGYVLRWEGPSLPTSAETEELLAANYHYAHARDLGQLEAVRIVSVTDGARAWCAERGLSESSLKVPPLVAGAIRSGTFIAPSKCYNCPS